MIFVNQPYIFTVDEAGQLGSKIELFIWNGSTPPVNPNYTFTKQIASATDTANYYNLSPFLSEFIQFGINDTDTFEPLNIEYYAKFKIQNYYLDEDGIYQPLFIGTPATDLAMYGQPFKGDVNFGGLLRQTTYETYSDCSEEISNKHLLTLIANTTNKTIRYTDLVTGATTTEVLTPVTANVGSLFVINASRYANGTKVELLSFTNAVVNTWKFIPKCECLYTPVKVQYLNNYGAFFTVWFYKANKQNFSIENSEFKAFQNVSGNYYDGKQRQTFNTSGREKITVNSDWVNEDFSEVIKDILLSEYTLVNDQFANIESKSIEVQSNINNSTNLINYQLTFIYSNDFNR
jgi:hypothetical protein